MGELAITQTWRDLAANQWILPKDTHAVLHDRYDAPELPDIVRLMDRVDEAYYGGELLRYGSANNPTYGTISRSLYRAIQEEYNRLTN